MNDTSKYEPVHKKHKWIKRLLPNTLFGRSLLILVLPIFLIQALSTFIFFDRHWGKMTSRLAYAVAGEVAIVVHFFDENTSEDVVDRMVALYESRLDMLITFDEGQQLEVLNNVGSETWGGLESMVRKTLARVLSNTLEYPHQVDVDFREKWIEVRVQIPDGVLNITLPQRRLFSSTTYIFLIWIFSISTILLIISVLFMRNQIRPIRRLALAAERFGKGRDVKNFKIEGAREVRQAGQAFLDMKVRIQRQINQRTDMLAGVSHDLRTPLTRLKLQVAMMGDSPDICDMKNDIHDMERMIEGYLNFVRGEGGEEAVAMDIASILRDVTTSAKRQGCDVELNLNNITADLLLRPVSFKRCLNNIVSNAAKYGDFIWITLKKIGDSEVEIVIEDNGPGIEEEKFEDVFRPFYRVDSSRNISDGSVGLGLPISMDIVHAHGGEIWLERSRYNGLAVHIRLPM